METIRKSILEVTVISGENLCMDGNPVTENVYVAVRADSIRCWTTKMAKEEGESLGLGLGYPIWNEKLMVEMPLHAESITFEVQCKTSKGRVRSVGVARIAICDVLPKEEGCLEVLRYRLRNWEGRRSGVVNFLVRLKKEEDDEEQDSKRMEKKGMIEGNSGGFKPERMGGQVDHHHDLNVNNGVVMGIPVWWCNHPEIHV